MPVFLTCPCGRNLQVKDEFAGQDGRCPWCDRKLVIPPVEVVVPVEHVTTDYQKIPSVETKAAAPKPSGGEHMGRIPHHTGDPLPGDADFFVDPPAEIGLLESAATTLRFGMQPRSPGARARLMLVLALVGLLVGWIIVKVLDIQSDFWWPWMVGGLGLGVFLGWFTSKFEHTCTYVGEEGVAHYECSGRRDHLKRADVFLFRDATELRTEQTRNYTNGFYQNTSYTFTWTDVGGRQRYQISNSHESKEGTPPLDDLFHYARAAEMAWTMDLLKQAQRHVELAGSVRFNLKGNRWIRLGNERIIFRLYEKPEEWNTDDLARVYVEDGTVTFLRAHGPKGLLPSPGVYRFPFANLANAQLFLLLLNKLIGIQPEYIE